MDSTDDVIVKPMRPRNLSAALNDIQWAGARGSILPIWICPPPRSLMKGNPRCFWRGNGTPRHARPSEPSPAQS
jgi:hypothetical protein